MFAKAVVLEGPQVLGLADLALTEPGPADVVVETEFSGISTGTEKLLWSGRMPPFPGLGYPLVPGYESVGRVVEAGATSGRRAGDRVFVPGASCYGPVRGLFGGASSRIVVPGARIHHVPESLGAEAALMALAATAVHALAGGPLPDLIVGHGVLGRLMARACLALGHRPTVWEISPARRSGAEGYSVIDPETDTRRDYAAICDMSGDTAVLDSLIARLAPRGEICLAGFYAEPVSFAFPPAFMREARLRIAAEWQPADLHRTVEMVESGALSLSGLITHTRPAATAPEAYRTAFEDPTCLKMILDWRAQ